MALEIKTKTTGVMDFTKIDITDMIPEYTVDEAQLEKDLKRVLKAYGKREEVSDIAGGDMITISCESEIPKFNKLGIVVPVGKGIFSKALEAELIGKKVGDSFVSNIDGKEVSVKIEKSIRTVLPELTDENVAAMNMDGISTVTDLKRYCIDKQLDRLLDDFEPMDEAAALVWKQFGEEIQVEFDPDEMAVALEKGEKQLEQVQDSMVEFESEEEKELYEADFEEEFGESRSEMDMEEFIRNMFVNELKLAAYGYSLAKGTDREITEEQYEERIEKWMTYHEGMSVEEVKEIHTVKDFLIEGYSEQVCSDIDKFVLGCFKEKMNPLR